MSGFIFVAIVRVRNVGFLAIVRNVVCTNCRGALAVTALILFRFENRLFCFVLKSAVLSRFEIGCFVPHSKKSLKSSQDTQHKKNIHILMN